MALAAWRSHLREYFDDVTERWIGWTFPPVERAIERAKWKPDGFDAYCGRCGDSVGLGEATVDGCGTCRKGAELSGGIANGVVRLGPYVTSLRDWIVQIKYQRWAEMGEYLGRRLAEQIIASNLIDPKRAVVVPMPMPWQRRLYRGIDHSRLIGSAVARTFRAKLRNVLIKSNGPPQVALASSLRRRSGAHGLRIRKRLTRWNLNDAHLILVDDVRTTGASLRAATRLLKTLKPKRIICAVLAVSDSKARLDRAQQNQAVHS